MMVTVEGKEPSAQHSGDALMIPPGTVHAHRNASATEPRVFVECVLVEEGQRRAIFVR